MTLGLPLYRLLSRIVSVFIGAILSRRVRAGKEDPSRLNERRARKLPARPSGPIVWMHGASVGESMLLLELGKRLQAERPNLQILFTSQTQTSAALIADNLPSRAFHQMAPIDTQGNARRFLAHWNPALGIMAEGEIWPNLILQAKRRGIRLALVNARMTQKSLRGWKRWRATARKTIGAFDMILAADEQTALGLQTLLNRSIPHPGNLKSALPPPSADEKELARLRDEFIGARKCWVAASTHETEENLVLEAWSKAAPKPALIIAPRHPERGTAVLQSAKKFSSHVSNRVSDEPISLDTEILVAATLGEMGLWYCLADTIYLGGGHAEGVGGHNPLEPLKLGKTVITGPDVFNFADIMKELEAIGAVRFASDASALASLSAEQHSIDHVGLRDWLSKSDAPMRETLNAILPLLEPKP